MSGNLKYFQALIKFCKSNLIFISLFHLIISRLMNKYKWKFLWTFFCWKQFRILSKLLHQKFKRCKCCLNAISLVEKLKYMESFTLSDIRRYNDSKNVIRLYNNSRRLILDLNNFSFNFSNIFNVHKEGLKLFSIL